MAVEFVSPKLVRSSRSQVAWLRSYEVGSVLLIPEAGDLAGSSSPVLDLLACLHGEFQLCEPCGQGFQVEPKSPGTGFTACL